MQIFDTSLQRSVTSAAACKVGLCARVSTLVRNHQMCGILKAAHLRLDALSNVHCGAFGYGSAQSHTFVLLSRPATGLATLISASCSVCNANLAQLELAEPMVSRAVLFDEPPAEERSILSVLRFSIFTGLHTNFTRSAPNDERPASLALDFLHQCMPRYRSPPAFHARGCRDLLGRGCQLNVCSALLHAACPPVLCCQLAISANAAKFCHLQACISKQQPPAKLSLLERQQSRKSGPGRSIQRIQASLSAARKGMVSTTRSILPAAAVCLHHPYPAPPPAYGSNGPSCTTV